MKEIFWIVGLCISLPVPAQSQDASLRIELPGGRSTTLTVVRARTLAVDTVRQTSHDGRSRLYKAVSLPDVLAAAGLPIDSLRVGRSAWTIVAVARDGYLVAFSAAEADPSLGPSRVWVAFEVDGQPLTNAEGPFRLVVPTDAKGARAAHQVVTIRVVDAAAAR